MLIIVYLFKPEELHVANARRRHEDVTAVVGMVEILPL